MKESYWGYWLIVLGVFVVVVLLLVQNVTSSNTQDYYLIKSISESAMIDAVDYGYYMEYGELKINKEKFYESFLRRFAEEASVATTYDIKFADIYEAPPKVGVEVSSKSNTFTLISDSDSFDIVNRVDGILELNGTVPEKKANELISNTDEEPIVKQTNKSSSSSVLSATPDNLKTLINNQSALKSEMDVTSCFGERKINGQTQIHNGIDVSTNNQESLVLSMTSGTVYKIVNNYGNDRGKYIIVKVDGIEDTYILYQHLSSVESLSVGAKINQGATIGKSGGSGTSEKSYAIHLHIEVCQGAECTANISGANLNADSTVKGWNSKVIDPTKLFTSADYAGYCSTSSDGCAGPKNANKLGCGSYSEWKKTH